MSDCFDFRILNRDGAARRGVLTTPHGVVQTPAFMPVGTRGAVKSITQRDLEDLGAEIILGNTYHLYLKPGDGLIARAGGLHRFIGWNRPILTDSGGYQVFSLAAMRRIDDEGATFRSHLDGSLHLLTPERAADIQAQLGSDIAMVLDECVASPAGPEPAREAMERSVRWARRARARLLQIRHDPASAPEVLVTNPGQAQFGIIQGGISPGLRTESVQATVELGFEAYAIGGLSVGEPVEVMYEVVAHTAPRLPDRPAALPDGHRHARRPLRVRRARGGPVRLRPPDAQRAQRPAPHAPRTARHQERALCRGLLAAGSGLRAATPAGTFPAPTCATFSSPAR